jgi:hypothetical protein
MIASLLSRARWLKQRDLNLEAARKNLAALVNPDGAWKYERDHPAVKQANRFWITRARNCHNIALGRIPVLEDFIYIDNNHYSRGAIFVGAK